MVTTQVHAGWYMQEKYKSTQTIVIWEEKKTNLLLSSTPKWEITFSPQNKIPQASL